MSEPSFEDTTGNKRDAGVSEPAAVQASAGELLRQARTAAGLHIGTLAASIKVPVRKLELLEADRFDELPDPAFARALAQTVCRALKIDAAPVLVRLPRVGEPQALEQLSRGLNAPFREGAMGSRLGVSSSLTLVATAATVLLLLGAIVMLAVPQISGWFGGDTDTADAAPAGLVIEPAGGPRGVTTSTAPAFPAPLVIGNGAPSEAAPTSPARGRSPGAELPNGAPAGSPAAAPPSVAGSDSVGQAAEPLQSPVPQSAQAAGDEPRSSASADAVAPPAAPVQPTVDVASAPADTAETTAAAPVNGANAPAEVGRFPVVLLATDRSWVEVRDASGQVLLSRLLEPGIPAGVEGRFPISVIVGNAGATQLWARGEPVDLSASARENVARVQLR